MEKFRPTIILSAAITLDGKIATYKGDSELSSNKTLGIILQLSFLPPSLFFSFLTLLLTPHLLCQQSFHPCFKNEARN